MPFKISLFTRKPFSSQFSIERVNEIIYAELKTLHENIDIVHAKHKSKGLLKRIKVWFQFQKLDTDIKHLAGDVYFAAISPFKNNTIITIHDCEFINRSYGLKKLLLKIFWLFFPILSCKKVIAISFSTAKDIVKHMPSAKKKIVVIPNPIVVPQIIKPSPIQGKYIIMVGTKQNKNIELMVEALIPLNTKLVIIGKRKKYIEEILVKHNSVSCYSQVDKELYFSIFKGAQALAFCSLNEGFGMPIIEAQLLGVPVLTSNISAMPEVAAEGALLVNPLDKNQIFMAMSQLINDGNLREIIIRKGLENSNRFSPSLIAKEYLKLYHTTFYN